MQHYVKKFNEEYEAAAKDPRGFLAHFADNLDWLCQLDEDTVARNALEKRFRFLTIMNAALFLTEDGSVLQARMLIEELRGDLQKYNGR